MKGWQSRFTASDLRRPKMLTYEKFKERALSDPEVRAEYDTLEPEFALFD